MGDLAGRMETFRRENKEPSIIGVTESWGRDNLLLNLKDFTAYRNDRSDGKGGQSFMSKMKSNKGYVDH